jgi:hypothetical protein
MPNNPPNLFIRTIAEENYLSRSCLVTAGQEGLWMYDEMATHSTNLGLPENHPPILA